MEGSRDPRTDGDLLAATLIDPQAFGVFYRRHVRGVLAFFRRRVPTPEVAFDLCAETFAAALEAAPRYRPQREPAGDADGPAREPARSWLYGIAWNKLHEAQRRGRAEDRARRGLGMEPIVLTEDGIERLERLGGRPVLTLLDELPADQRDAVRARVLDERTYPEIAAELRCSESVVRQRVSRGVRTMRRLLEDRER